MASHATSDPAFMVTAATIEARFATATTERSMPPEIIVGKTARDKSPNSGNWKPMDWRFDEDRNVGLAIASATNISAVRIPRLLR